MIIDEQDIDKAKLAGNIAAKALIFGKSIISPGVSIVEALDRIEQFVKDNGGEMAFPAQVAINDVAAHACPLSDDNTKFDVDDIVKLDLGVQIDGLIADNALTIIFRESKKYDELNNIKKASEEALANVLKQVKPGVSIGELGLIIQETIALHDLSPIKNLSGHGLGKFSVHEHPTIPNFNTHDKTILAHNQMIAIEPFATNGHGMIYESTNGTVFSLLHEKNVRSMMTRDVLSDIKSYNKLPFTTRWLTKKHSLAKVNFAIRDLKNLGIIHEYPPLIEINHGLVSQSEHTVIVRENPIITTARQDFE